MGLWQSKYALEEGRMDFNVTFESIVAIPSS